MTSNAYVMSFTVHSRVQRGELHDWSMNSIFKTGKVISSKIWAYYVKNIFL